MYLQSVKRNSIAIQVCVSMFNVTVRGRWELSPHKLNKEALIQFATATKRSLGGKTLRYQTKGYISACKMELRLICKDTWANKCNYIYLRPLKRRVEENLCRK